MNHLAVSLCSLSLDSLFADRLIPLLAIPCLFAFAIRGFDSSRIPMLADMFYRQFA